MKKIVIAIFFAILMLLVPISSVASAPDVTKLKNVYNAPLSTPEIYITQSQLNLINKFIDENFEGEDKTRAEDIRDFIIETNTLKVDITNLAGALVEHGYQPIPQSELDLVETKAQLQELIELFWVLDLFGSLVFLITSTVANRLGWLYTMINDGYDLFSDGVQLAIRILDQSLELVLDFVNAVNLILTIPQVFSDMMDKLFSEEFDEFLAIVGDFINNFVNDFSALIFSLIDVFLFIPEIWGYLKNDIAPFIGWILGAHWKDDIQVQGLILKNFLPLRNANITCRGESTMTDSRGVFSLKVNVNPSDDSFPPNEYFGLHNCKITVEKDGTVIKETSDILSYVFSGGGITWPILIRTPRLKTVGLGNLIVERIYSFLYRLYLLMPNFFKIKDRIDILLL
jgi:hypothetical protein